MATFLERYRAGDRVAVWDELVALGEGVRHKRYCADAVAVAAETMRRARHNVELLIQRLDGMGYRFVTMEARDRYERQALKRYLRTKQMLALKLHPGDMTIVSDSKERRSELEAAAVKLADKASRGKPPLKNRDVLDRPTKRTAQQLYKLEKMAGGPLPLSLRAWYEQVGAVSLLGYTGTLLSGKDVPSGGPDPLIIYSQDLALQMMKEDWDEREDSAWWQHGRIRLPLAPDRVFKAGGGGCGPYEMVIPNLCADGIFEDGNKRTFVNYLRNVFECGGFPGWKHKKQTHEIVAKLTGGLLPL
jgi:hypothetical protein